MVPQAYPELGFWVHEQRKDHSARKRGEKSALTDERYRKLKDAGFVFAVINRQRKRRRDYRVGDRGNDLYSESEQSSSSEEEDESHTPMPLVQPYTALNRTEHHGGPGVRASSSHHQPMMAPAPLRPDTAYAPWERYDAHHHF